MFKVVFYVPVEGCEKVKQAMFEAGAGRVGLYECCSWQTVGQGQFRGLQGANPAIGQVDQIETVEEYCVEMVCDERYIKAAIQALLQSHPYETPAYSYWKIQTA